MARLGTILRRVVGYAVAFASQAPSAATRAGTDSAQQTLVPASVFGSQRLRDEIKAVEEMPPRLGPRSGRFFCCHLIMPGSVSRRTVDVLTQCVAVDEGFDLAGDRTFASLQGNPNFTIASSARDGEIASTPGACCVHCGSKRFLPEGLGVDASKRMFYMGSEYHNKIVRAPEAGDVTDFVKEEIYD